MITFVLGGAQCVWRDFEAAKALCTPDKIACVNDIGIEYPDKYDYWVSYHNINLQRWLRQRRERNLPDPNEIWTGEAKSRTDLKCLRRYKVRGGSSGMLATCIALSQGATHVVLAGVPMDPNMRHFHNDKKGKPWKEAKKYHKYWLEQLEFFNGRVRSMSGWTRETLGVPTLEWLDS